MAERLTADGMRVIVHYAGKADEVVGAITEAGGTATAIRADVADEEEVAATNGAVDAMTHILAKELRGRDVSFLAGPARWVNGQIQYADGGVAYVGSRLHPA